MYILIVYASPSKRMIFSLRNLIKISEELFVIDHLDLPFNKFRLNQPYILKKDQIKKIGNDCNSGCDLLVLEYFDISKKRPGQVN